MRKSVEKISTGLLTTTVGGAATGKISGIHGAIKQVEVVLGTSTSADVTIVLTDNTAVKVFEKTSITASVIYPVGQKKTNYQGSASTDFYDDFYAHGDLNVTVANGGNALTLTVNVYYV